MDLYKDEIMRQFQHSCSVLISNNPLCYQFLPALCRQWHTVRSIGAGTWTWYLIICYNSLSGDSLGNLGL
jgi:hypothetical protein